MFGRDDKARESIKQLRLRVEELERQQKIYFNVQHPRFLLDIPMYAPLKTVVYRILDHLKLDIEYVAGKDESFVVKKRKKK